MKKIVKKIGTKSPVKKTITKKPLSKAQNGKVVRTKDAGTSATAYPYINPASNANRKGSVDVTFNDSNESTRVMAGPTKTKKGVLGRTVQKTTTTEVTEPKGPKGKAYGTVTSEKDVFNKRGNLVKSTSKERDINTGKLNKVNKFNYKKEWFKTGGTIKPKAKKK